MTNYYLVLFLLIKVPSNVLGYKGELFPEKYLNTDGIIPTEDDFNHYLFQLESSVNFFHQNPNNTDINRALGLYIMKAVLGRTLVDYSHKLKKYQLFLISDLMKKAHNILSHFIYEYNHVFDDQDFKYFRRVGDLFRDDTSMVFTMEEFNKNRLKKYLKSEDNINEYLRDFDDLTMPKELYVSLVELRLKKYHIRINASDKCIGRVMKTADPIHLHNWQPCRPDPFCKKSMSTDPSVAYNLSHRVVNLVLYRLTRQCYWDSPEADATLIDRLCAHMYRETVYIARRGYFSRDLFLEHIDLCALMGYEEFHRRNWFYKVSSWQDKRGCIQEFNNFEMNRTTVLLKDIRHQTLNVKQIKRARRKVYLDFCHNHPMALLVGVLAHGMRYAAHYMTPAVLGRTLVDYSHKLKKFQNDLVVDLIKKSRNVLSHFTYENKHVLKLAHTGNLGDLFRDDRFIVHTMGTFNKNSLKTYLKNEDNINEFLKDFDDLALPKEIYVTLVQMRLKKYYISVEASDKCIGRVMKTTEPLQLHKWQPCPPDPFCKRSISTDPSVAYNLSHRVVNMVLYRLTRQCYWESPEMDAAHITRLCAQMYRETVYIARRGFFSRDLFLEHIALCALMGYEEFYRRNWFYKITSWQDRHGCIQEFNNFEVNRTLVMLKDVRDQPLKAKWIKRKRRQVLLDLCHNHQMALLIAVLAHGIRHAAHYITTI